ncbi:hypothetical protein DSO57_1030201 [Entomophthora muscae]|uniref:Uncharacterized protein n=1 Tax=Entomophthora muscae TaxID=34485 RepID=A0ACC2S383_9FUNG|nr:hypothetical protein DSO57_1030201 [Entomophthora muscae]
MTITHYQPKATEAKPITHRSLARFLEVSVFKHSRFPVAGTSGSQNFYYKLISTTSAPTNHVVLGMLYLTKLRSVNSPLLEEYPGNLMFTVCLMLAFDILDDTPYDTRSWSSLSGYSRRQITTVANKILQALDYRLTITTSAFSKYKFLMLGYASSPAGFTSRFSLLSPPSSPSLRLPRIKLPPLEPKPSMSWGLQSKDIFCPIL